LLRGFDSYMSYECPSLDCGQLPLGLINCTERAVHLR
jgi:hypothetical protein